MELRGGSQSPSLHSILVKRVAHPHPEETGQRQPRLAAYPLTVSEARDDVLRDANHNGHARGVIPLITPPTIPLEQREIVSLLSGLAVTLVPPAPRAPPPPPVPVAPGLEAPHEEVVVPRPTWCRRMPQPARPAGRPPAVPLSVCEQYFSVYDKGDQPGANALTAAQEALWWVLFTEQQSFGWVASWSKLLDHPQLDAQRMQHEAGGPNAPPRQQGVHAFDTLRREHTRTASNAATASSRVRRRSSPRPLCPRSRPRMWRRTLPASLWPCHRSLIAPRAAPHAEHCSVSPCGVCTPLASSADASSRSHPSPLPLHCVLLC